MNVILLDIDGVMVTTPPWVQCELLEDGFMKFNEEATRNLVRLLTETNSKIILISNHRINFSEIELVSLFYKRGIYCTNITKINDCESVESMLDRATEIENWVKSNGHENYVIIDDDIRINKLSTDIKSRWVRTKSLIGFNDEAFINAKNILNNYESN